MRFAGRLNRPVSGGSAGQAEGAECRKHRSDARFDSVAAVRGSGDRALCVLCNFRETEETDDVGWCRMLPA